MNSKVIKVLKFPSAVGILIGRSIHSVAKVYAVLPFFDVKCLHCKYLNARSECNDIVIFVYSHYPLDPNAKSSDTKGNTFSIR